MSGLEALQSVQFVTAKGEAFCRANNPLPPGSNLLDVPGIDIEILRLR